MTDNNTNETPIHMEVGDQTETEVFLYDYYLYDVSFEVGQTLNYNLEECALSKKEAFLKWKKKRYDEKDDEEIYNMIKDMDPKIENGKVLINCTAVRICIKLHELIKAAGSCNSYGDVEIFDISSEWMEICTEAEYALEKFDRET